MDYRLTDPHLDPPGQFDADYSEESIRPAGDFLVLRSADRRAACEFASRRSKSVHHFWLPEQFHQGARRLLCRLQRRWCGLRRDAFCCGAWLPGWVRQHVLSRLESEKSRQRVWNSTSTRSRHSNTWIFTTASISASTHHRMEGIPPASTHFGWACRRSRWWAKRWSDAQACATSNLGLAELAAETPEHTSPRRSSLPTIYPGSQSRVDLTRANGGNRRS